MAQQNEYGHIERIRIGQFHPLRGAKIQRSWRYHEDQRTRLADLPLDGCGDGFLIAGLITLIGPDFGMQVCQQVLNGVLQQISLECVIAGVGQEDPGRCLCHDFAPVG